MPHSAARLAIVAAGLAAAAWIVSSSFDRDSYFYYRFQDRTQWEHPTSGVALVLVATVLETSLALFVFATSRLGRLWIRACVALSALLPWCWWVSQFIIHMPGFWLNHVLWVWLVTSLVAVALVTSALMHAWRAFLSRHHSHA